MVTSLMFIIATMVEFAGMLLLQRMHDIKEEGRVRAIGEIVPRGSFKMQKFSAKIDGAALIVFLLAFIAFNACYWIHSLNIS